jgi:hypothetical protein
MGKIAELLAWRGRLEIFGEEEQSLVGAGTTTSHARTRWSREPGHRAGQP